MEIGGKEIAPEIEGYIEELSEIAFLGVQGMEFATAKIRKRRASRN